MFKSKLEHTNTLSDDKSRKVQKMVARLMKYLEKNNIDRVSISYMSELCECNSSPDNWKYMDINIMDTKSNTLFSAAYWK